MNIKLSEFEKIMLVSVLFTFVLTATRYLYTSDPVYLFYPWNLFLAVLPMYFSRQLQGLKRLRLKALLLLGCWLLFLPNAPYLVTDLFHFEQRKSMPYWYDLILVVSGAWNGLMLGMVSLMQAERFLSRHINRKLILPFIMLLIVLCSYGIYLGRYNRYNSWDVVTTPLTVFHTIFSHCTSPVNHKSVWLFTFAFSAMLGIVYFTIRRLAFINDTQKK